MNVYETVKNLVFIDGEAAPEREKLLETVIDLTEKKLLSRIGEESVPPSLDFIVVEVAIIRFNRIGSEGMAREAQDGRTIEFNADDFSAYNGVIDAYLADKADGPGKRPQDRELRNHRRACRIPPCRRHRRGPGARTAALRYRGHRRRHRAPKIARHREL